MNKPEARVAVVAMTPTNFSIADPQDRGMLDVVLYCAGLDVAGYSSRVGWMAG